MINRSLYFPIVLLLFSFLNCPGTKEPESENLFYGVVLAETARLNTPYTGSCDNITKSSVCENYVSGYTVRTATCGAGTLSTDRCPAQDSIGYCEGIDNGVESFQVVYYISGGGTLDLASIISACEAYGYTFVLIYNG